MYTTDFWILWEKVRVGWSERIASKHVYYQVWNRSPVQVGCMRQVLGAGALGWPRGMGWGGRWEEGSGWGTHVNPWLIHVNVWHKPLQYCKVISLQLLKINGKKKKDTKSIPHLGRWTKLHLLKGGVPKKLNILKTLWSSWLAHMDHFSNLLIFLSDPYNINYSSYTFACQETAVAPGESWILRQC